MCEVPFSEAPELFGAREDPDGCAHCFVKRQPETPYEVERMLSAIRFAELACIRYRGGDRRIQLTLVEADVGDVCDELPPDLRSRVDELEANRKRQWEQRAKAANPWWKFLK